MNPLLYSLAFGGFILLIPVYSWLLSWTIPVKWMEVYKRKLDRKADIVVSIFAIVGMGLLTAIIAQSHLAKGFVSISAVEYRESGIELVLLSILLIMFVIHLALQLQIYRRRLE